MKTKLVGVHKVGATLADGSPVTYYYAWRGGPRMTTKPDTVAFTQEFVRLTKGRDVVSKKETLDELIDDYVGSGAFTTLGANTKRDYHRSIGMIRVKFGTLPKIAIEAKGSRKLFLGWRDTMSSTPRAADLHMTVLARIFSCAMDKEDITRNPLEGVEKLWEGGARKDAIWMPSQLNQMMDNGAAHLADVVKVALWTMQRQGDVLTMPTIAFDDERLWITQGKTGARVKVRAPAELMPIIERAKAKNQQRILVNSYGDNWTSSGFRASFGKETKRLKIVGVTFHDLRGTGISYAYANGMDIEQIANISGHSKAECEAIIRRHYLAGGDVLDEIRSGTKNENGTRV